MWLLRHGLTTSHSRRNNIYWISVQQICNSVRHTALNRRCWGRRLFLFERRLSRNLTLGRETLSHLWTRTYGSSSYSRCECFKYEKVLSCTPREHIQGGSAIVDTWKFIMRNVYATYPLQHSHICLNLSYCASIRSMWPPFLRISSWIRWHVFVITRRYVSLAIPLHNSTSIPVISDSLDGFRGNWFCFKKPCKKKQEGLGSGLRSGQNLLRLWRSS